MREIFFRGKRKDTGEWVYGDLAHSIPGNPMIAVIEGANDGRDFLIIPETFGQYTGLKDKNGNRIFEGDILRGSIWLDHCDSEPCEKECHEKYWGNVCYEVFYDAEVTSFELRADVDRQKNKIKGKRKTIDYATMGLTSYGIDDDKMEIIGNIHDTPELLGREKGLFDEEESENE